MATMRARDAIALHAPFGCVPGTGERMQGLSWEVPEAFCLRRSTVTETERQGHEEVSSDGSCSQDSNGGGGSGGQNDKDKDD